MSDFREFPTKGYMYKIVLGDTLYDISAKAYGDPEQWRKIYNANSAQLRSGDPNLIFPGEIVFIPGLPEIDLIKKKGNEKISGKAKDEMTLKIADREIITESKSFTTTIDTMSDGWTAVIAWEPGFDKTLDEITKKYSYSDALIYIGNDLQASGKLYVVEQSLSPEGSTKTLEFYSHNYELVRNTAKPPYQRKKVSLLQRCQQYAEIYGLNVEIDTGLDDQFENDINSVFDVMTIAPTEKIFDHLQKYAKQKGVLLSSTIHGDVLLTRAKTTGEILDTFKEGESPFPESFSAKFDGKNRYSVTRLIGQTPGKTQLVGIAKDEAVKGNSHITIQANDTTGGDIQAAAEYAKNKSIADAYSQELPITDWYGPKGKLLQKNGLYDVVSTTIDAPSGFTFLCRRVNFSSSANGQTSVISIVPPSVYSKEVLEES